MIRFFLEISLRSLYTFHIFRVRRSGPWLRLAAIKRGARFHMSEFPVG